MDKRFCRTCLSRRLPDVVEPCKSCVEKSNWNKQKESARRPKEGVFVKQIMVIEGKFESPEIIHLA